MEKKKIGHRTEEYNILKAKRAELEELSGALVALAKQILGVDKISDYVAFMAMPYGYIVSEFFALYGKNEPPHTDKERFLLSKIQVNRSEIQKLSKQIAEQSRNMGGKKPTITEAGMVFDIKEEDYDIYLHPDKKEEYEAVEKLYNAAIQLKEKFGTDYNCRSVDITRFHPGLRFEGSNGFGIDPYRYSK